MSSATGAADITAVTSFVCTCFCCYLKASVSCSVEISCLHVYVLIDCCVPSRPFLVAGDHAAIGCSAHRRFAETDGLRQVLTYPAGAGGQRFQLPS